MTRREIIAYTSSLTGAALAAPLLSSLLVGCKESAISDTTQDTLHFFSSEEFSLIQKIVDTILPQTDSPSATQVGVDYMIDLMVGQVYNMEDKTTYRSNFDQLKASLSNVSDQDLGNKLEELLTNNASDALLQLKQQTVAYYLSTEEVAKNHLNYLPIPGEYEGCIELSSVNNKAWAS